LLKLEELENELLEKLNELELDEKLLELEELKTRRARAKNCSMNC